MNQQTKQFLKTILIFVFFGSVGLYLYLARPIVDLPVEPPITYPSAQSCEKLGVKINTLVKQANHCADDADCIVSEEVKSLCGCWRFINKNYNTNTIKQDIELYNNQCVQRVLCEPCLTEPRKEEVACENNTCVINEFAIQAQDEILLPLILHPVRESGVHTTARTDEGILALFENTQTIWSQAGIAFEVTLEKVRIQDQIAPTTMGSYPFFTHVVASTNDNALHVYYIRDLAGANGWTVGPRHIAVADITTVDDFRATAHEIGHLFGLGHAADNEESLMASGRNGQKISEGEIHTARKRAQQF